MDISDDDGEGGHIHLPSSTPFTKIVKKVGNCRLEVIPVRDPLVGHQFAVDQDQIEHDFLHMRSDGFLP